MFATAIHAAHADINAYEVEHRYDEGNDFRPLRDVIYDTIFADLLDQNIAPSAAAAIAEESTDDELLAMYDVSCEPEWL